MKIIAVDFDGTLCESKWPEIGRANQPIINYLLLRKAEGDKLILWTCRTGQLLDDAVLWSLQHGLRFDAVNANLPERIAEYGNDCRKISADEYWDDKSAIVFAGDNPSIILKTNIGYTHINWANAEITVAALSPRERLKRWWKKWRCE